ncbi:MAG TPA: non-ribosomal peptide synthetase, partial [Polyangiaceae bacterium]|nr:non-ribosomal peptide synthetase [Polyangiaceae bacterium]
SCLDAFRERARAMPGAMAVRCAGTSLSYAELDAASSRIASVLRANAVAPEQRVAVCMDRTPAMVAAVLAVWKAGAAFVPIDPASPPRRVAQIVEDASIRFAIAGAEDAASLPSSVRVFVASECLADALSSPVGPADEGATGEEEGAVPPERLAYVLYTSGSTGQPKGVMVAHGSLSRYVGWVNDSFLGPREESFPTIALLSFDACLKQFLAPLVRGHGAWLIPTATVLQPVELVRELAARTPVGLNCVPSHWVALLGEFESGRVPALPGLTCLVLGGEPPSEDLLARTWRIWPRLTVFNVYGPTEATANAAVAELRPNESVNVGRPIAFTRIYVLDDRLRPSPIGVEGTLYIGGENLAIGYLGAPELTAAKFIPDPFAAPGSRMFDTGDRARRRADGRIEVLGRRDGQVKIRGSRVELGEVEVAIRSSGHVADAVVTARGEGLDRKLVAYLLPTDGAPVDVARLRAALRPSLPEVMLPAAYVVLERWPLLSSGKIDRSALPEPGADVVLAPARVPPRTDLELTIAGAWKQVLGTDVGIHESFFEIGGNSLAVIRLRSDLCDRLGRDVPLLAFFRFPTIYALAEHLSGEGSTRPVVNDSEQRARIRGNDALATLRRRAKGPTATLGAMLPPDRDDL